jgi:hypothetical protein
MLFMGVSSSNGSLGAASTIPGHGGCTALVMRKLTTLLTVALLATACAHPGNPPAVRAGGDADNPRARDAGRAAGAGGSHAPGSTGLGAGTMGVESSARVGSAR